MSGDEIQKIRLCTRDQVPCKFVMKDGCCDLLTMTGVSRLKAKKAGASITPPDCEFYSPGVDSVLMRTGIVLPGSPRKERVKRVNVGIDQTQFVSLYQQGLNDREISDAMGISQNRVFAARKKLGLASNHQNVDRNKVLALWREGLNDVEIGKRLGCAQSTVRLARIKLGLKSNYDPRNPREK